VHGVAERLLDGRDLRADLPRVGRPQDVGRQLDVLGEAAVAADADDHVLAADVGLADAALVAGAADDVALGRDDILDAQAVPRGDVRADGHDLAHQLVADDAHRALFALERVEDHALEGDAIPDPPIRTAESGVEHLDEGAIGVGAAHGFVETRDRLAGHLEPPRGVPGHAGLVVDETLHRVGGIRRVGGQGVPPCPGVRPSGVRQFKRSES